MATKKPAKTAKRTKRPIDRLLILADWLEKVVKPSLNGAKFSMYTWGNQMPPATVKKAKECGYAACAIGWGLVCPALKKDGIVEAAELRATKTYGLDLNEWRMQEFFGVEGRSIDYEDAFYHLFMPGSYPRPTLHNVVRRLRNAHKQISKKLDEADRLVSW